MVLTWIWLAMIGFAVLASLLNGSGSVLAGALMDGAANAVTLSLTLAGSLCLWTGVSRLLEQSGITGLLSRLLRPILGRLYPKAARHREAFEPLCANVCANLLGLGNAATPFGIQAVQAMAKGSRKGTASDEMCRLIVMNTASIQLLPTTVAAVRAANGAAQPFAILPEVWLTSAASVSAGLILCKVLQRWVR